MAELIDMLFGVSTLRSPESLPTKRHFWASYLLLRQAQTCVQQYSQQVYCRNLQKNFSEGWLFHNWVSDGNRHALQIIMTQNTDSTCLVQVFLPQWVVTSNVKLIVAMVPATLADLVLRQPNMNIHLELRRDVVIWRLRSLGGFQTSHHHGVWVTIAHILSLQPTTKYTIGNKSVLKIIVTQ